jgi:hypothetical protein
MEQGAKEYQGVKTPGPDHMKKREKSDEPKRNGAGKEH